METQRESSGHAVRAGVGDVDGDGESLRNDGCSRNCGSDVVAMIASRDSPFEGSRMRGEVYALVVPSCSLLPLISVPLNLFWYFEHVKLLDIDKTPISTTGHRGELVFFPKMCPLLWKFVIQNVVAAVYRKKGPCELQKQGSCNRDETSGRQ